MGYAAAFGRSHVGGSFDVPNFTSDERGNASAVAMHADILGRKRSKKPDVLTHFEVET